MGLCVAGAIPWLRGGLFVVAQLLGGIIAAALVSCMFPGELVVGTTLNHDTSIVQGLFIEMFLTTLLVLAVLFLAVEKQKATFIAPLGIGLALFVAELTGTPERLVLSVPSANIYIIRGIFHRWLFKSYALLWSSRCRSQLSKSPLDILAWSHHGSCLRVPLLQVC